VNTGHSIEFRAEWAGENLRKGIKGSWYIQEVTGSPRTAGRFHIWPAMEGWQRIGQRAASPIPPSLLDDRPKSAKGAMSDTPRRIMVFKVEKDQLCAMCYENPINVCLQPCGHTAICKACEQSLRHRLCPICYTPVTMIITEQGTVERSRPAKNPMRNPAVYQGPYASSSSYQGP
jgi:hypothetical protein